MEKEDVTGRCEGCEYLTILGGGGWSFPACRHEPYKGKWCREIENCPLGRDNQKN